MLNFSHFASQVRLFLVEKRKPKVFGFKNVMERGNRKIVSFVIISGKIILRPLSHVPIR